MQKNIETEVIRRDVPIVEADVDQGLTAAQVRERTANGWANGMPQSASKTEKEIVLEKCLTFFNLVFVVLALVLVIAGSSVKNMLFLGIMVSNTVIGIFQEIRAKRAVDKLTLVAVQQVRTIRDGQLVRIRSSKLVRDDIVEFAAGDQICADGILRTGSLQVNESLVTGEEDAIVKLPGDRLKSGSFVVAGNGRIQLTKVGADSFAAKLAMEAKANPQASKSEMMRSLDKLIRVVGFGLIPIGIVLFYQCLAKLNQPLQESAESTVAALIGMIPEGLYLLTSVAMAVSAIKLTQKKVLVQDMNCIETLARVDVLCVDKTGTITEAVMEVDDVVPLTDDDPERLEQVLAAMHTGVEPDNDTARAMTEMFAGRTSWQCIKRIPFTSKTKWSAAVFEEQGAFVVGAPEFIMDSRYEELRQSVESWSSYGYRVLLVAQYNADPDPAGLVVERLQPLALVLVSNRVRPEAEETFRYFVEQGVKIKVISGDNPVTVSEVARRAGIENADRYIDAGFLKEDQDFLRAVEQYTVFGRVTPDKKKKLIMALQKRGHTVAMTGDGVNDVLAMKQADCGIAMASGAQAASQVAQLVLLHSDFSVMPNIVAEGRRVINNIQRTATLFLVKNIFSLGLAVINLIMGIQYPLQPIHLSVISAMTIGVPSFFLAMEPNYERVQGRFIPTIMRKALPGGLTNIFVVLMAQLFMVVFGMKLEQVSSVCAAILAVVGLLVLYQTCKPFGTIRRLIWGTMAAGLLVCFTFFRGFFELHLEDHATSLVMVVLLIMTPTVFFAAQRVFDWGDQLTGFIKRKFKRR